jgi:hypothetical protein
MVQIIQINKEELQAVVKDCLRDFIEEIRNTPFPVELPDDCLFAEACEIAGVSESKMYKLSATGEIPVKKYNGKLVFSINDLREYRDNKTIVKTTPEEIRLSKSIKQA